MPPRTHSVRITLALSAADYHVFETAVRHLRGLMGRHAPDVPALLHFNLHNRDATGLADDYLDGVCWPHSAGRVVSLTLSRGPNRRLTRQTVCTLS